MVSRELHLWDRVQKEVFMHTGPQAEATACLSVDSYRLEENHTDTFLELPPSVKEEEANYCFTSGLSDMAASWCYGSRLA